MGFSIQAATLFDYSLPDFLRFRPGISKVTPFNFILFPLLLIGAWNQREVNSSPQAPCCLLRLQEC